MALASESTTFCIPLISAKPAEIAGDSSVGSGFTFNDQFVGDEDNVGLNYLADPDQLQSTDWPLVLSGPSGTGKTAIAFSIATRLARKSSLKLVAFTASEFYRKFADAVETNTTDQFRSFVLSSSAVFLDDLDNLKKHVAAQDQLSILIDELLQRETPVICTASENWFVSAGLTSKLCSRLSAGLSLEVKPPGLQARRQIIEQTAKHFDFSISDAACDYLSPLLSVTYPGIRTYFLRLRTWLKSEGQSDTTIDETVIADFFEQSSLVSRKMSVDLIVKLVARSFKITVIEMKSGSRKKSTVLARSVVIYILRNHFRMSYSAIGRLLGGRDHSTIMHSLKRIELLIESNDKKVVSITRSIEQSIIEYSLLDLNSRC